MSVQLRVDVGTFNGMQDWIQSRGGEVKQIVMNLGFVEKNLG